MFAQEKAGQPQELSSLERLGLRVSEMINSPLAQLGRRVLIHRLDTDSAKDWDSIKEVLAETSGLEVTLFSERSMIVEWHDSAASCDKVFSGDELRVIGTRPLPDRSSIERNYY